MKPHIDTRITIDAPASVVWQVLTDLAAYHEWNPFIRRASGTAALGERIVCEPQLPGSDRLRHFTPTVTRCEPEREFAWFGAVVHRWFAGGEHIFRIEPEGEGRVRLLHQEVFSGLMTPLAARFALEPTREGFVLMNEALKARAEALRG